MRRLRRLTVLWAGSLLTACVAGADARAPSPLPAAFWSTWGDGQAEVGTYDLVQPRYGQLRNGIATLIVVTEDFSYDARVKADPGQHPADDLRPVLKLNLLRDFQTGVYPYHTMTSAFLRLEAGDGMAPMDPLKLTTSITEWCGHVFERWTPRAGRLAIHRDTYFDADDAEANDQPPATRKLPAGTVYGDALPVLVRGLTGDGLQPGQARTAPYLPRQIDVRFAHVEPTLGSVALRRAAAPSAFHSGIGDTAADTYTAAVEGGVTFTFHVEAAWPHRLLGWEGTDGESAVLRGVDRMPYWALNHPGDEAAAARIGAPPPVGR